MRLRSRTIESVRMEPRTLTTGGRRRPLTDKTLTIGAHPRQNGPLRSDSTEVSMLQEFKEFINKGNAIDLAVGVVIGAAFGKIVDSLVNDIIMPVVGLVTGGVDFSSRFVVLGRSDALFVTVAEAKAAGLPVL